MKKNTKKNNRKLWLPLFLCVAILVSIVVPFIPSVLAKEQAVEVEWNGEVVDSVSLQQDEKETLTAVVNGMEALSFQWQILLAPQSSWVNIADKTSEDCEISVALLNTMLDTSSCAYLRCAVTGVEETAYSDAVCVMVLPQPEPEAQNTAEDQLHSIVSDSVQMRSIAKSFSTANAVVLNSGAGSEADDEDFVSITIKYLDYESLSGGTESSVFSSYVANIEKGSDFNQSVVSPTYVGFAPYQDSNANGTIDESDQDASSVALNYSNVQTDAVIKVYYKPISVPFAVRFFFQNVLDDLYTEDAARYHLGSAETGTIITDEMIGQWEESTEGFTSLYHVPQSVAADGSTVFECYYDRNYYLIQFDLAGGYGVDPIYARYGAAFVVNTPIRAGYRFDGWQLYMIDQNDDGAWDDAAYPSGEGVVSIVTAVPSHNYYYRATWSAETVKYTTVYWLGDPDTAYVDNNNHVQHGSYDYLGSKILSATSGSSVSGSDDLTNSTPICGKEEHTHSDADGCYDNCTLLSHVCPLAHFTGQNPSLADNNADTDVKKAYKFLKENETPIEGYVYRSHPNWVRHYNFLYCSEQWYYLGMANVLAGVETDGELIFPQSPGVAKCPAKKRFCNAASTHTHNADCLSCIKEEHTHSESCRIDMTYYEFERADSSVEVKGDGSTVVNVYYIPKRYTLRFYYAAKERDGTWEIVGGSTYPFGHLDYPSDNDIKLLDHEFNAIKQGIQHVNVGGVRALPKMNARGNSRSYTFASTEPDESANGRTYYYFEFSAEYGQNISELWPIDVFEPAARSDKPSNPPNGWTREQAFVSAWNGEYYVKYSVDHASSSDGNQTIKGKQERLGEDLLFDRRFINQVGDSSTVSFLCFWENGVDNKPSSWNVPNLFLYNIWVPVLPGDLETSTASTTVVGEPVKVKDGITYKRIDSYPTCDNSSYWDSPQGVSYVDSQTQPSLVGYTSLAKVGRREDSITAEELSHCSNLDDYKEKYAIDFFYTRLSNPFSMQNYGDEILSSASVPYETKLSTWLAGSTHSGLDADSVYTYRPDYPSTLEQGAYEFQGWYTTDQCFPGTEFDLSTGTMPARGMILYAKWELVQHTVNFFASLDDMQSFENGSITDWSEEAGAAHWKKTLSVNHGSDIGAVVTAPERDDTGFTDLRFAGWFYLENGQKKALTAQNMPITKDLNVFADWRSRETVPYRIHYVLASDESTKVAEDSTGEAFGGSTRTFTAKAGNQLSEAYRTGYFPTVSSHSINLHTGEENTYTFRYAHVDNVTYKVQYLNKTTNRPVAEEIEMSTSSAAVTARFKAVPDMVPDAFFKSLVLKVDYDEATQQYVSSAENVITFYYIPNTDTAFYAVHFMLEKLGATDDEKQNYAVDGSGGYAESGTMIEGVGNKNQNASITPQNLTGFKLIESPAPKIVDSDGAESDAGKSGDAYLLPIQENGTELFFFYRRLSFPYRVRYYLYNTERHVPGSAEFSGPAAPYGTTVSATAPIFPDYTLVSPSTQSVTIHEETGSEERNTIIFYYTPKQYVAEYVAVPEEGGRLSLTIEVVNGAANLEGSTPTPRKGYQFENWYVDAGCTQPVTSDNGSIDPVTHAFTPNRSNLSTSGRNIFYAKFIPSAADLTITRSGAESDQVFVYAVTNNATGDVIYVTVTGNGSTTIHDLPMGDYTVTQQNDWSWRYTDSDIANVSHTDPAGTNVEFHQPAQTDQWVNGNTAPTPNQKGGAP